jgi:adenosine deaminase
LSAARVPAASGPGDVVAPRDLAALPKVELHVHLEGTIAADTASELAARHGEEPDAVLDLVDGAYPDRFRDFDHFVATFLATSAQVRTPDDLATVAAAFARDRAEQHVLYTEVTFTAATLVAQGMEPAAMWRALADGFAEAPDVTIALIVDSVRNLGVDAARRTVELVRAADAPIVALGLTGVEGSVPERDFAVLREAADELGIGLVVHAGETGTPDNVRSALDDLGADRIGHGIASLGDPELVARLARDQVVLEICPSSNVTLGLVPSLDEHPLPELAFAGVPVTINSDDPPFFATTLTDELRHAARLLGATRRDVAELQRRAIRASYATARLRRAVLARIDAWDAAPSV